MSNPALDPHGWLMPSGRHIGERITRIPVSYLKWMINVGHSHAAMAEAEMGRRGTVTPDLDVSGHAIDKASLSCRSIWHNTRGGNEGLHAWLIRMATEAREKGDRDPATDGYLWRGMRFQFEEECCWPVLKTVMPDKKATA